MKEHLIIRESFFDELFYEEQLGAADDGMDALLKRLHGGKSLEGFTDENGGGTGPPPRTGDGSPVMASNLSFNT